jgi:hypothetical protein
VLFHALLYDDGVGLRLPLEPLLLPRVHHCVRPFLEDVEIKEVESE